MEKDKTTAEYSLLVSEIINRHERPLKACVRSYGCQLNFSDGEKLKGMLLKMGYSLTDREEGADLVIFNTCAVRENAEDRVFGNLGYLKHYKEKNPHMIIGLCGCMAAIKKTEDRIRESYRFVDLLFSPSALDKLPKLLYEKLRGSRYSFDTNEYELTPEGLEQQRDSSFKASVPIMFGCNNFCTYCIVPYVRGREHSRRADSIIREVQELADKGYREIMLLGQNVNSYGNDLDDGMDFPTLLEKIDRIDGDFVVRFMSSHPKDAGKRLIDTIVNSSKIGRHLHLPLQSGSDEILSRMNRRYTVEKYMETVDYARSIIPDFSFTTDLIVGFPNESEEDFLRTLDIMKRVRYDNIYSFIYSKRTGTKAALIDDRITDEEKSERMTRLLALQREISTESYKRFIGRKMRVLIDGRGKKPGIMTGKSSEFIIAEVEGDDSMMGRFVDIQVTGSKNWAVTGSVISNNS